MQICTFLLLLRQILGEYLKPAPPIEKQPPLDVEISVFSREISLNLGEDLFFFFLFWRPLDFGRKKPFNFGFGPKIRTQLRRSLFFFFGDHPILSGKILANFRAFREISSEFSDNPSETDSRRMKIRVKVVCTFLTLSK